MTEQAKTHINHIDIEMDRDTLAILITVFEKMIEDADMIDFDRMDLSDFSEFEELTNKFKEIYARDQNPATIRLSFNEWVTYDGYVDHADDIELTAEEKNTMDSMYSQNAEIYRQNIAPKGP